MPKPRPTFDIGYTVTRALKRRKTLYTTGPMAGADGSAFAIVTMLGRIYKITIEEVDNK